MHISVRRWSFFIFLAVLTIYFSQSVSAAEKKAQHLVCLHAVQCNSSSSACVGGNDPHRVRLTSESQHPVLPSKQTYILECLSTSKGQICTTGNADNSPEIGWSSSLSDLKTLNGYAFEGIYKSGTTSFDQSKEPIVSDGKGEIEPLEWQSTTSQSTYRTFYALNFYEPTILQGNGQTSQQQSTFDLIADNSDCTSLQWDPYGVVFDSQTLEPIPNTRITLYQKNSSGFVIATIPGVTSSIVTRQDGVFNFVVPDGVYKLEVSQPDYLPFPADFNTINPGYNKIYSDLYPTGGVNAEIAQVKGIQQHRDIPLTPKQNTTGQYPLQVMDYYEFLQKFSSVMVIKGRVSHPFTKIKVYTNASPKHYLPNEAQASKDGTFKVEINLSTLAAGEYIAGLEFEKVNLTGPLSKRSVINIVSSLSHLFIKEVSAQQQTVTNLKVDPILNNIDGYAYDNNGKVVANATVGIYLPFSKQPYYETTADAQGYFKISSDFLPSVPYTLQFKNASSSVTRTTSDFLLQNANYIQSKNINPFIRTDAKGTVIIPTATPAPKDSNSELLAPEPRYKSRAYYFVIIGILIFGVVGTLIGVYIINKRTHVL